MIYPIAGSSGAQVAQREAEPGGEDLGRTECHKHRYFRHTGDFERPIQSKYLAYFWWRSCHEQKTMDCETLFAFLY